MATKIEELNQVIDAVRAKGLEPDVVVEFGIGDSGGSLPPVPPPPSPPPIVKPERFVTFKDTLNNLVPSYDMPDVNSTKSLEIFEKRELLESVPPAGHKGMPKEPDLNEREAHALNLFTTWAWLPRQMIQKANGNWMSFPQSGINGADLSTYPGMWIPRSALVTSTDAAWIKALVAYLKTQW